MQRHEDSIRRDEYMVGLLASLLANPYRKKNQRPAAPQDWFPRLRPADDKPEWVKLKEAFGFR